MANTPLGKLKLLALSMLLALPLAAVFSALSTVKAHAETFSTPGQVIENRTVGCVVIGANNITLRNVTVRCSPGSYTNAIHAVGKSGLTIENSDISYNNSNSYGNGANAIYLQDTDRVTIKNSKIRSIGDAIIMVNRAHNTQIIDNTITQPSYQTFINNNGHADVIQITAGNNTYIARNTITQPTGKGGQHGGYVANVLAKNDEGDINGVTIENNNLSGGGFTLYCMAGFRNDINSYTRPRDPSISKKYTPGGCVYRNNKFTRVSGNVGPLMMNNSPVDSDLNAAAATLTQKNKDRNYCNKFTDNTSITTAISDANKYTKYVSYDNGSCKPGVDGSSITPPPPPPITPTPPPPPPIACSESNVVCEDFSSNANNFTASNGSWSVGNGQYNVSAPGDGGFGKLGPKAIHASSLSGAYTLNANATVVGTSSTFNDFGVIFGYKDDSNYNYVSFNESNDNGTSGIFQVVNGMAAEVANIDTLITANQQYSIKIERNDNTVTAYLNNQQVASANVSDATGKVGFGTRNDSASFDNLTVSGLTTPTPPPPTPPTPTPPTPPTPTPPTPPASTGNFNVRGAVIYDPEGNPFLPKGLNVAGAKSYVWGEEFNAHGKSDYFKDTLKLNAIRLVYCERCTSHGPGSKTYGDIHDLINEYTSKKMVIIIDWHEGALGGPRTAAERTESKSFFADLASRYKDNPYVWYEPFNEAVEEGPGQTNASRDWVALNEPVIQAIRGTGAQNIVVVNASHFGQDRWSVNANPIIESESSILQFGPELNAKYPNLVYDNHFYSRWAYGTSDETARDYFRRLAQKGLAVLVGETGAYSGSFEAVAGDKAAAQRLYRVKPNGVGIFPWMGPYTTTASGNSSDVSSLHMQWVNNPPSAIPDGATATPPPPPTPGTSTAIRINAAGNGFTDPSGNTWIADAYFNDGNTVSRGGIGIDNTDNDTVYQTERWGTSGYQIPVANGTYEVKLHFAETYEGITRAGQRVFTASVEGNNLGQVDVYGETGGHNRALVKTANVTVSDGTVNVDFGKINQEGMVNGIEVVPVGSTNPTPPTPTPPTPTPPPSSAPNEPCFSFSSENGLIDYDASVQQGGVYTVWLRMKANDPNSIMVMNVGSQDNSQSCIAQLRDTAAVNGTEWAWVSKKIDGSKFQVNLSAGRTKIQLAGHPNFNNVGVDRILLVAGDCVPTGSTGNCTGSTKPTPTPPPPPPPTPVGTAIRIDAANTASFTDSAGNIWSPDTYFNDGSTVERGNVPIEDTEVDTLYQTERWGTSGYQIPVANGTYSVKLHFSETYDQITGPGQRVFGASVEGVSLGDIDIFAQTGGRNRALVKEVIVAVNDGKVNIDLAGKTTRTPIINALEVISSNGTPTPPSQTPPPATPPPTPPPSSDGWPNAANTGPRTTPTKRYSGPSGGAGGCYEVTTSLDGYIFDKCVRTKVNGITISNSNITHDGSAWGLEDGAGGAKFEYNYITDTGHGAQGVMCSGGTRVYRNNIKGFADGLKCTTNSQIIENYVHDLSMYNTSSGGTHNDYIQALGGSGLTIKGNTFATSCNPPGGCNGIILQNSHKNSTIEGNYFERYTGSTTGYVIHLSQSSGVTVKNNVFNCAQHKPKFGAPLGILGGIDGGGNRCQ